MHSPILGCRLPSVAALAYLGDAEYTVYVRRALIARGVESAGELNRLSLLYVTAQRQSAAMRALEDELLEDEHDVFRRAKNSPHLNRPKHASPMEYRYATGFEAVLGMLSYIDDRERMRQLMQAAMDMPVNNCEV